jgi:hypothetical protein
MAIDLFSLDWVAVYGAFLATILAIREVGKSRKKIWGGLNQSRFFDIDSGKWHHTFNLSFANKSSRPIQIDSINLLCGKESYTLTENAFNDPKPVLPIYLQESEGKTFSLKIPNIVSWLKFRYPGEKWVTLKALLITSDGVPCRSKPSPFNIEYYEDVYKSEIIPLSDPRKQEQIKPLT